MGIIDYDGCSLKKIMGLCGRKNKRKYVDEEEELRSLIIFLLWVVFYSVN